MAAQSEINRVLHPSNTAVAATGSDVLATQLMPPARSNLNLMFYKLGMRRTADVDGLG